MRRLMAMVTPLVILGGFLYILTHFKHVQRLNAEEQNVIAQFHSERLKNVPVYCRGVFSKEVCRDTVPLLKRLYDGSENVIFHGKRGHRLDRPGDDFVKIRGILDSEEYPYKYKEFLDAVRWDLNEAEKGYGKIRSHHILNDLSHDIFISDNGARARSWNSLKSFRVLNKLGLRPHR